VNCTHVDTTYLVVSYSGLFMYIFIIFWGESNTNTAYADFKVSDII